MPVAGTQKRGGPPPVRPAVVDFLSGREGSLSVYNFNVLPRGKRVDEFRGVLKQIIEDDAGLSEDEKAIDIAQMNKVIDDYKAWVNDNNADFKFLTSKSGHGKDNIIIIENGRLVGEGLRKYWTTKFQAGEHKFMVLETIGEYGHATLVCEDTPDLPEKLKNLGTRALRAEGFALGVRHEGDEKRYNYSNGHILKVLNAVLANPEGISELIRKKRESLVGLDDIEALAAQPLAPIRGKIAQMNGGGQENFVQREQLP